VTQPNDSNSLVLPGDADAEARRRENLLRRRLMSGNWLDELTQRIAEHFDDVRQQTLGRPTMARNLARTVIRQLSVLYDQSPVERNQQRGGDTDALLDAAHKAGVWQLGTRLQQRTMLIREGVRGIATVGPEDRKRLLYRHINLDRVWADADPDNPDQPARFIEGRRRVIGGKDQWVWEGWKLGKEPRYAVMKPTTVKAGQDPFEVADDLTQHPDVFGPGASFTGDAYPWRYKTDEAFMPNVWYHAERTGDLFDSWEGAELIDGTLDTATLWTFWLHDVKDASWPQRYVLNAILRGEAIDGGQGFEKFASVSADPASIMQFYSSEMQAAHFGQWVPGADPNALELAISSFERATAAQFNLAPSDFVASGGAESGYALSIKRQAVREAQRRFEPQFRRGDEELLAKSAAMANRAGITRSAPEEDWEVTYPTMPMSPEERHAALERVEALDKLNLAPSRVWQVQQLEQVDRDNAIEIVVQWQRDEQELDERLAKEGVDVTGELTPDEVVAARALIQAQRAPLPSGLRGGGNSGQGDEVPGDEPTP